MNFSHNLKSIYIIWYRDFLHYWRDRTRVIASILMPLGFLVFSRGLSSIVGKLAGELFGPQVNFVQFLFPGVLGLSVFFVAIFSGASVVDDRNFGFLREILVAPVSRTAIVLGKICGGATIAVIQTSILLSIAPFIGLHLSFLVFSKLWFLMLLIGFALSAFGVLIGSAVKTNEAREMISYALIGPMALLSGAYFPLKNLPFWMNFFARINPLTYAVDALRQVVLQFSSETVALGINFFGRPFIVMSFMWDILIVCVFGIVMSSLAIWFFSKLD